MYLNYKILEHSADLKIQVKAKSLPNLFSNFLKAMVEFCQPEIDPSSLVSHQIQIKANNLESLLIDFLSEIIYLSDTNKEVYSQADLIIKNNELKGKIKGQKFKRLQTEIKAATWHDLEIKRINNQWQAIVLFDI